MDCLFPREEYKRSYDIFRKIQMVTLKILFTRFGFFDSLALNSLYLVSSELSWVSPYSEYVILYPYHLWNLTTDIDIITVSFKKCLKEYLYMYTY